MIPAIYPWFWRRFADTHPFKHFSDRYEMRDRTDLLLPGAQAALVAAVRKGLGAVKPLVLVLMGGGVIDTSEVCAPSAPYHGICPWLAWVQ